MYDDRSSYNPSLRDILDEFRFQLGSLLNLFRDLIKCCAFFVYGFDFPVLNLER